jgi:hypothetical protein
MTRDDIVCMAREAAAQHGHTIKETDEIVETLTSFYVLAVAAEREACADIVENADTPDCGGWTTDGIAAAIRARSNT